MKLKIIKLSILISQKILKINNPVNNNKEKKNKIKLMSNNKMVFKKKMR